MERESGMVATDTFLDGAVESFNFGHMFITGGYVEYCMEVSEVAAHGFELVFGKDDGNAKTA